MPNSIHKCVYRQAARRYIGPRVHTASQLTYIPAVIINIQETLDQILFAPAIINLGIDVLADTFAPCPERARRAGQDMGLFTYGTVMVSLKMYSFLLYLHF